MLGVHGAGAALVYNENGVELGRRAIYLNKPGTTNNVAEYCGLLIALELAQKVGATHVRVLGDSELVIRQFNRIYAVRKERLKPWYQETTRCSKVFEECIVELLPKAGPRNKRRHGNNVADSLATECMLMKRDLP